MEVEVEIIFQRLSLHFGCYLNRFYSVKIRDYILSHEYSA